MSDEFWTTSDGEDVTKTATKEFDSGGGSFDPIPDKTNCLLNIGAASWQKDQSFNEYISVEYSVIKPECFANRKIWQKLWVKDFDPNVKEKAKQIAKRDKARKMFATIDAICGGKLAKAGREPDDDDLALALTNKQLIGKVMVWEQNDNSGNWIAAVAPKGGSMEVSDIKAAPASASKPKAKASAHVDDDLGDDDIPF